MDPRRWPEADALLDELLALPASERAGALAARADVNPDLRAAVEAVLSEEEAGTSLPGAAALQDRPVWLDLNDLLRRTPADDVLKPGARFAQYEVLALVGRGGMGEVYRARDGRLGRDVALKVLPHDMADHPERLARFDREARLLASMNHPNIAAIYGLVEEDGRQALVLEFVEGETLAERTARGPLRVADVVSLARQVALALDAAHQRGVVHRDLKPANIKISPDGTAKVLDFGLAKALEGDAAVEHPSAGLTTEWKPAGALLGTPAYMSPEQALGQPADERSDIWAFGCVLYEMLTGARAFQGENAGEVMARVIEREPDFERLPSTTPDALRRLVRRSLVKDPKRRLASMADAVLEIDDAESGAGDRWRLPRTQRRVAASVGALALLALGAVIATVGLPRLSNDAPRAAVRLAVPVPASDSLIVGVQQVAALSPDGRTIVYRAVRQGRVRLFARTLDSLESHEIPGTENAAAPFFSPDGSWLGFDGDGMLRKISLAGGSPVTICPAPGGASASWARDTIVFATQTERVLQRVPAAGGVPEAITALDAARGDLAHAFPHLMPRADAVLFTLVTPARRQVAAVRLDTREVTILAEGAQPRYLPSGHLLFVRNDALWAVPFSDRQLALLGEPAPVLEALDTAGGSAAHFAVNEQGTLMYVPRREEVRERRLVWLDRAGVETPLRFGPARYQRAAISPDGTRLAVALSEAGNSDIWVAPVDQSSWIRLTRDATTETSPLWSPDGRSVIFRSDRDGGGLFSTSVDGLGDVSRLTSSGATLHTPHGWSADGKTLLFTEFRSYGEQVPAALVPGAKEVKHLLGGRFAQLRPQVSPDGRWIAYQSDESGRFEVYVRPFPSLEGGLWKVSIAGGTSPRWAQHGRELLYYDGTGFVSVPVPPGPRFEPGVAVTLFQYSPYSGRLGPDYDVTADGRRFLMIRSADDSPATRVQLVLVQHWLDELRGRMATK